MHESPCGYLSDTVAVCYPCVAWLGTGAERFFFQRQNKARWIALQVQHVEPSTAPIEAPPITSQHIPPRHHSYMDRDQKLGWISAHSLFAHASTLQ